MMLAPARVELIAAENGLLDIMNEPRDLDLPDHPEIVDIRVEYVGDPDVGRTLTIKVVETREVKTGFVERRDSVSGKLVREYSLAKKRAVNVAKLHENGLLELRIASRDNTKKYSDDVASFFNKIKPFLPVSEFRNVSLAKVKDTLVRERENLEGVRYSQSSARNDVGNVIQLAASTQQENLCDDSGAMAAMNSFLSEDGYVTGANVYFTLPGEERRQEIHVVLWGELNEFTIPVTCTPEDYVFVLRKILSLNSKTPAGELGFGAAAFASAEEAQHTEKHKAYS